MKTLKNILFPFLLLLSFLSGYSQQLELDRIVIGSASQSYDNGTDMVLDATIGEAFVETQETTDLIITTGFQQSNYILKNPLIIELSVSNAACLGANDGSIQVSFISNQLEEPIMYQWSNGDSEDGISGLEVGIYSVTATGSNGISVTNSAEVLAIENVDCTPIFYTGITPNGDGKNETWVIDNAEFFSTRKVKVYNRYGSLVWKSDNYDNVTNFFSGNHENGNSLSDGTYFFVAEFDDSRFKGQIEITSGDE